MQRKDKKVKKKGPLSGYMNFQWFQGTVGIKKFATDVFKRTRL